MPKTTKRSGRRKLPDSQKKKPGVSIKLTGDQRVTCEEAARLEKLKVSVWGRKVLDYVAERRNAGVVLEVAYDHYLNWVREKDRPRYDAIMAALARSSAAAEK